MFLVFIFIFDFYFYFFTFDFLFLFLIFTFYFLFHLCFHSILTVLLSSFVSPFVRFQLCLSYFLFRGVSFPLISLSLPIIGLFPLSFIWASLLSSDFIYRLLFVTYPHSNLCPPYLAWSYLPLKTFFHMFLYVVSLLPGQELNETSGFWSVVRAA